MITGTARATTSKSSLADQLVRAAQPAVLRKADRLGEACLDEIEASANRMHRNIRPPSRSRSTPKLGDRSAYNFDVLPTPKGGRVEVFVSAGDAFKVKFFSLNNGSRPHRIRVRNAATLAYNQYDGASTNYDTFPTAVNHPGTSGSNFYEMGVRRALARFRR